MSEVVQPQAPAAAAPAAPATPEKPISVAETVKAAFDKSAENVAAQPTKPVAEAKPAADPNAAKPQEAVDPAKLAETPEQAAAAEKLRTDRIPVGWKGGAATWHAQTPEAKAFIVERERQYNQGIQRHAQAANFAQEMVQEFQPYQAMLTSLGATPATASRFLLSKYYTLLSGTPAQKTQLVQELAQTAGVDLSGIARGETPQVDPELAHLREQVQRLTGAWTQQQQSAQTAETQYIHGEIERFAADPKNGHFEVLRPTMAALLQGGQAKDLQDAYDKASWMHPEVRASLVNQQFAQDAEKRKKQAEEAQRASVSLNAAPPAAAVDNGGSLSIRDLVAKGFAQASGRV